MDSGMSLFLLKTMQYTLDAIQADIAARFEFASSAPASSSEHYSRVTRLINDAERRWADTINYKWPQLVTSASLSIVADTPTVSMPSGYSKGRLILGSGGYLTINSIDYKFIDISELPDYTTGARVAYITGNNSSGYTLNLQPTPEESSTVTMHYYTENLATDSLGVDKEVMTTGSDITKCNVPRFIVFSVLSELYTVDETNINAGIDYERRARDEMEKALNALNESGQISIIPDTKITRGYSKLGAY